MSGYFLLISTLIGLGSEGTAFLLALASFLGEKGRVDVGEHTTGSNGDVAEELVELLIVPHSKLDVTGNDPALLVVLGGVAGELKDLSHEVLEDGREVHGGTASNALGVPSLTKETVDTTNGKGETSLLGPAYGSLLSTTASSGTGSGLSSFSTSHYFLCLLEVRSKDSDQKWGLIALF